MPESAETPSTSTSSILAIETFTIEKSLSTIIVEKKHFANMQSLFAS